MHEKKNEDKRSQSRIREGNGNLRGRDEGLRGAR